MERSASNLQTIGLPYFQAFAKAAQQYGVPLDLALRVAKQESGFQHTQRDGRITTSPTGALGLMQLEPKTAQGLGVNPFDVWQNIDGGVKYLGQMFKQFGGNEALAAAAYNAGPGRVDEYLKAGRPLPGETVNYVRSISAMKPTQAAAKPVQTMPVQGDGAGATPQGFSAAPAMPPGLLQIPGM